MDVVVDVDVGDPRFITRRATATLHLLLLAGLLAACRPSGGGAPAPPPHDAPAATPLYRELAAQPPRVLEAISRGGRLSFFTDDEGVRRATTTLAAALDESPAWVGLTPRDREEIGYDGEGVVVGIVDTGIDWTHPDFLGPDGTTRILYLLDLSLPAEYPDPHPEVYHGDRRVYGKREIDAALADIRAGGKGDGVESRDTVGHGTHVASIAAGRDPAERYTGIAPGAWLVVVKATRDDGAARFEDADVAMGAQFVIQACGRVGAPCVVNLSLGGHMGGHDGGSWIEKELSRMTQWGWWGRAIVASAGNQGGEAVHAACDLPGGGGGGEGGGEGAAREVALRVPRNAPETEDGAARVVLDAWMREAWDVGEEGEGGRGVSIEVVTPSGARVAASPGDLVTVLVGRTWVTVSHSPEGPDRWSGDREAVITLTGEPAAGGAIDEGAYVVRFTSGRRAAVDLYLAQEELDGGLWGELALEGECVTAAGTVTVPATSRFVVAAGAITTKLAWTGADGTPVDWGGGEEAAGETAFFSGRGPSRGGAVKPDVAAPGEWVAAALSSQADRSGGGSILGGYLPNSVTTQDLLHVHARGTSAAAPHVSGIVALVFDANPWLAMEQVWTTLLFATLDDANAARLKEAAPAGEGFGVPDAVRAVDIALGRRALVADPARSLVVASAALHDPGMADAVEVYVLALGEGLMPAGITHEVTVEATACAFEGEVWASEPGLFSAIWSCAGEDEPPPPGTKVYVSATIDGRKVGSAAVIEIVRGRAPADPLLETAGSGTGACSITIP